MISIAKGTSKHAHAHTHTHIDNISSANYVYTLMIVVSTLWNLINRFNSKSGHSCVHLIYRHLPDKITTRVVKNGYGSS